MESSPRKVFIDLIHDLHDLSILFDTKVESKCISNLEIDILSSFYKNLTLTIKLGYSINNLSSTKLHSHLSLLMDLCTELLSRDVKNENENNLEIFLSQVFNIFRFMFEIGFYGNNNFLTTKKDISKIRNFLLNAIQMQLSIRHYQLLYKKYILPILFNFIFYTDEWIKKCNFILPDFCVVYSLQSESTEHQSDNKEKNFLLETKENSLIETQKVCHPNNEESEVCQTILFVPFQLKSIAIRNVRDSLIAILGKDGFYDFYKQSLLPSQLCNDVTFITECRADMYCYNLFTILELCPEKLKDVLSQQFCISTDDI